MWGANETLGARLAVGVPALVIGLAAGVSGGVLAARALDSTPYGPTEFNTASRDAHQAGKTEGMREAQQQSAQAASRVQAQNEEKLASLEARLARTRHALTKQERSFKDAKRKSDEREARLVSSLAERTAALDNATSEARASADSQAVEGTLRSTWVLRGKDKPWPEGCAKPLRTYQVRVSADKATVANGALVDSELVKRKVHKGVLTLTCSMTYTANLPTPLGTEYRFLALDTVNSDQAHRTGQAKKVPSDVLADGAGPALSITRSVTKSATR